MAEQVDTRQLAAALAEISEGARAIDRLGFLLEPFSDLDQEDRQALAYAVRMLGQRVGWLADTVGIRNGVIDGAGLTAEDWMFPPLAKRSGVQS